NSTKFYLRQLLLGRHVSSKEQIQVDEAMGTGYHVVHGRLASSGAWERYESLQQGTYLELLRAYRALFTGPCFKNLNRMLGLLRPEWYLMMDSKVVHRLFILRSSPHHMTFSLDFKSREAKVALSTYWETLEVDQAEASIAAVEGLSIAAAMRGWLFERYTILCFERSNVPELLVGFWEMETQGGNMKAKDVEMTGISTEIGVASSEGRGKEGTEEGKEEREGKGRTFFVKGISNDRFPQLERQIHAYNNVEKDVCVDETQLYVPRAEINLPFDAFFFEKKRRIPHQLLSGGYHHLQQIREIAHKEVGPGNDDRVEFRYVLVEPNLHEAHHVTYTLPSSTQTAKWIPGKVYLQILAVGVQLGANSHYGSRHVQYDSVLEVIINLRASRWETYQTFEYRGHSGIVDGMRRMSCPRWCSFQYARERGKNSKRGFALTKAEAPDENVGTFKRLK
ncbi:hypothetical protein K435DRAFT_792623, partial [Dendrothele bispora CBS 962.96]